MLYEVITLRNKAHHRLSLNLGPLKDLILPVVKSLQRILRYANYLYLQGQDKVKLGLQLLDIELQNIIDAQLWAKENGSSQNVLKLVNEFPNVITSYSIHYTKLYDSNCPLQLK